MKKKIAEEIQDLIQREQLEILALTDMRDEKRAELRELSEKIIKTEIKPTSVPSPRKLKARKTPSKSKSILSDMNDPFVLSRTESLRRSIQRVKSPHSRRQPPSSGLRSTTTDPGNENNAPQTPTPRSISHMQIEKNLSQLRSHSHVQSEFPQPSASPQKPVATLEPSPLLSASQDLPNPSANEAITTQQLPESRMNTIYRLNKAFWKSATMTEMLMGLHDDLRQQWQGGDGEITYQSTILALQNLVQSYPTSNLTPAQLIEAVLYKLLLEALSSSDSGDSVSGHRLEVISYEQEWCFPLELVKTVLVQACTRFGVDISLNRTVVYFLVGKGVVRIERRASPIVVCVC